MAIHREESLTENEPPVSGHLQHRHAEVLSRTKFGRASKHAPRRRWRLLDHPSRLDRVAVEHLRA
jgi:hypothetical protein